MIQRIQSLYLLLAALCLILLASLPLASLGLTAADSSRAIYHLTLWGIAPLSGPVNDSTPVGTLFHPIGVMLTLSCILLSLTTIFLYKNRSLQKRLCSILLVLQLLLCGALAALLIHAFGHFDPVVLSTPGLYNAPFSVVFLLLARRGIVRDDRLVKSLDRIR
ncbi:MAG: DUF4293 family protein [Alistipes sp.]|nr:DUF4293 family protein [Alistipes sp.]